MLAFKTVRQTHPTSNQLLSLLDEFRRMVNFCVFIGIGRGVSSLMTLTPLTYPRLAKSVMSCYGVCAIRTATSIIKNYRRAKRKNPRTAFPLARRLMLTTCYGFKIGNGILRLPIKSGTHFRIKLNDHTMRAISDGNVSSITLTPSTLSVNYCREAADIQPEGWLGVDRNLNNVTTASAEAMDRTFDLSKATVIKSTYRTILRRFCRNDRRVRRKIYGKFGVKQRDRVQPLLHRVSRSIVNDAKTSRFGIALERLTGIRRVYRRNNGQSRNYRARMNSWSFAELERQIVYKTKWEGVKVAIVSARNTSEQCSL